MGRSQLRWLWFIPPVLPAIVPLYLIYTYGVDVPYQDQWGIAKLFIKAHQGQLTLTDLFAQANEHRIVVPRLLFLLLGWISHWNTKWEMVAEWVIVAGTSLGILRLCHRTMDDRPQLESSSRITGRTLFLWFVCNLLLFTPTAWEDWLWGMGVQFVLPPALLIAGLIVLDLNFKPWLKTGIGMLLCTAATFSNGNGALCWPLLGMVLAWSNSWTEFKSKKWLLTVWTAGFLLNVGLYLFHYTFLPQPPDASNGPGGILQRLLYGLAFLGTPLANSTNLDPLIMSRCIGTAMLILLLAAAGYFLWSWLRHRDYEFCRRMVVWFAMGGFAVLNAVMVGLFRSHLQPVLAISSRYCPFAACLPIALVNLVPMICRDMVRRRQFDPGFTTAQPWAVSLPAFLASALILFNLLGFPHAFLGCQQERIIRLYWKGSVLMAKLAPDNYLVSYDAGSTEPEILKKIAALDAMGYLHPPVIQNANASEIEAPPGTIAEGAIENIVQDGPELLRITGWAISPDHRIPVRPILITYLNERNEPIIFTLMDRFIPRPEIAPLKGNPVLAGVGWSATLSVKRLPTGLPLIRFQAWALDAESGKASKLEKDVVVRRD